MTDDSPLLPGTIYNVRSLSFIVLMFAGTGYEMMLLFAIINSHCQRAGNFRARLRLLWLRYRRSRGNFPSLAKEGMREAPPHAIRRPP